MGQNLSEPKTEKETEKFENANFSVGSSCMQGWRLEMEDAHSVQLNFAGDRDSSYFGVFDGHGTAKFADYCSSHLHCSLQSDPAFKEGDYSSALRNSFLTIDRKLQEDPGLQLQHESGGTTAITCLVRDNKIFCANAGDSRAVACVAGRVQELSNDHKPYNRGEEARIYRAGGWVEFNRVNGNLALSRAIGDFNFKSNHDLSQADQIVTANPEVKTVDITPDHEFIVVACDGVWDVMSNIEVAEFIRKKIASNVRPPAICEALLDHCLAPDCRMGGVGCDNMSVILACFLHREGYEELVHHCSRDLTGKIPRTRRFSSMCSMDRQRARHRDRRMSEPPAPVSSSPVVPCKLKEMSSLSNGGFNCDGSPVSSDGERRSEGGAVTVEEVADEDGDVSMPQGSIL